MSRRFLIGWLLLPVLLAGWYWFRPERLFINAVAHDDYSEQAAQLLAEGQFHSVAHETRGTAKVYRSPDGVRVLRLTDFHTSNGPDVRVILVAAEDAADSRNVTDSGFVELGPLRGNLGDQNYEVPPIVDLDKHRAVTIWCQRFSVNFGTAPLHPGMQ